MIKTRLRRVTTGAQFLIASSRGALAVSVGGGGPLDSVFFFLPHGQSNANEKQRAAQNNSEMRGIKADSRDSRGLNWGCLRWRSEVAEAAGGIIQSSDSRGV